MQLQLGRHTNQTQVPETQNFASQKVLYADEMFFEEK
jgi:hypothetical protein